MKELPCGLKNIAFSIGAGLFLYAGICFGQNSTQDVFSVKQQETSLQQIEEEFPALYKLEKRIQELQDQIQSIVTQYKQNEIDRKIAEEKIRSLLNEQLEIKNSKEYEREVALYGFFASVRVNPKQQNQSGTFTLFGKKAETKPIFSLDRSLASMMNSQQ